MIRIAARDSPLSKAQTQEILIKWQSLYPDLKILPLYLKTCGDLDKTTSLRGMEKTDFFTRELDDLVLNHKCDAAVHSAKDLPEPMRKGLIVGALTPCIDGRDALVYLNDLPENPLIATSSVRREDSVRVLFPKARFVDLRGTIHERLETIFTKKVDGVVIAEAALIRLQLTHLRRMYLPLETALHQGRLAIVIREDNAVLQNLLLRFGF